MNISSIGSQLDSASVLPSDTGRSQASSEALPMPNLVDKLDSKSVSVPVEKELTPEALHDVLEQQVAAFNSVVKDLRASVRFEIEESDAGGYFVRVVDESGKSIKTIPMEEIVRSRERIRAEVKGLIEDSQI